MIYFTEEQIRKLHNSLISKTGGLYGIRDSNLLDLSLKSPFQTFDLKDLYPEIIDKAAQLCFSMIENHPFLDGNKRIGVHLMLVFLELNNIKIEYSQKDLIDFGLGVASGKISRVEIKEWIINHTILRIT